MTNQSLKDLDLKEPALTASATAVEKAKAAAEAIEVSRAAQFASMLEESDVRNVRILSDVLRRVFGENEDSGKFINVSRIPLICQAIVGIHESISKIESKLDGGVVTKDQFWPVKTLVYGATGTILLAILSAIVALVLTKQ